MPSRSYKCYRYRGIPGDHKHASQSIPWYYALPHLPQPPIAPSAQACWMPDPEQTPLLALHHLLRRTGRIIWDVRSHPSTSRHPGDNERMESPRRVRINATEPGTRGMKIIFEHLEWEIEVVPNGREFVFIDDVLLEIYHFLQEPLPKTEWYKLGGIMQRICVHTCRCDRIIEGPVTFELDSSIKMIDVLGVYTVFGGLRPLGPMEWLLSFQERPNPKLRPNTF